MFSLLRKMNPIYWVCIVVIIVSIFFHVQIDLTIPDYMGDIVNAVMTKQPVSMIVSIGWKMLGLCLISVLLMILENYLATMVGSGLARHTRQRLFQKVESFSMEEINQFSTASLITRSTNDIQQVQQVTMMVLRIAIMAPIMAIGAIIKIIGKSGQLSLLTMVAVICLLLVLTTLFLLVSPKFTRIQKSNDMLNMVTRENLTGLRVIRANNAEDIQEEKFEQVNSMLVKLNLFVGRAMNLLNPFMNIVMSGLSLSIIWWGASLMNANLIDLGSVTAFISYSMQILSSFMMLTIVFIMFPRGMVSAKRINEVLHKETKITDGIGLEKVYESHPELQGTLGEVEFDHVYFKYPNAQEAVLHDITFTAHKGETIAFIGSTGSGKSTVINLIPRFYDVTSGSIKVDGINVKEYKIEELNNKIGYVPQKGVLFRGTIASNIAYGKEDATKEEIVAAAKVAQAHSFIEQFPEGYDHEIAQGGTNVSGGQKQRLSIARAIIKKPEIYIFDDSFSALDYKTDKELRSQLKNYTQGVTTFIVAQRIGTIMDADKIIVLDNGKMVGMGTHEELLKNCQVYQEIAYSQLSKEELDGTAK